MSDIRASLVIALISTLMVSHPTIVAGQDVQTGSKIRLSAPRLTNPQLTGRLVRQTPDSLWIRYHDFRAPLQFSWAELSRLEVKQPPATRSRSVLEGATAFAMIGAVVGFGFGQSHPNRCDDCEKQPPPTSLYSVPLGAAFGSIIGMVVGVITTPSKWESVDVPERRR